MNRSGDMEVILIDSGLDLEQDDLVCTDGFNLIEVGKKAFDEIGHGTMCSRVIQLHSKSLVEFIPIKILNQDNESSISLLIEALNRTEEIDCRLINLSLSTTSHEKVAQLEIVTERLWKMGKIIIASMPNSGKTGYPAMINHVIGVDGAVFQDHDEYWYNNRYLVQCVANRLPVMVKGLADSYNMFGGTSKAACVITALVGNILEHSPGLSFREIQEILERNAKRNFWQKDTLESMQHYVIDKRQQEKNSKEKIEKIIEDYIFSKTRSISKEQLRKYGYQPFLTDNDFFEIIKMLEEYFRITLPKYDGISYRIFDNATTLYEYFGNISNLSK